MLAKVTLKNGRSFDGVKVQESDVFVVYREFVDFIPFDLWVVKKDQIKNVDIDEEINNSVVYRKYQSYKEKTRFSQEDLSSVKSILKHLESLEVLIGCEIDDLGTSIVEILDVNDDAVYCIDVNTTLTDNHGVDLTYDKFDIITLDGPYHHELEKHYYGGDGKYGRAFLNHFDFRAIHIRVPVQIDKKNGHGVVSFVWTKDKEHSTVTYGVSICTPKDNFEKAKAVKNAHRRIVHDNCCVTIPISADSGYTQIAKDVIADWNDTWTDSQDASEIFGMVRVPNWARNIKSDLMERCISKLVNSPTRRNCIRLFKNIDVPTDNVDAFLNHFKTLDNKERSLREFVNQHIKGDNINE